MTSLINWLALRPTPTDLEQLQVRLMASLPVRQASRALVEITLSGYPWIGRDDLIPAYHPSETHRKGQYLALPLPDPQKVRPTVWQVARLKQIDYGENPVQGRFQIFTLEIAGKQIDVAAGVPLGDAHRFPRLNFSKYSPEDLDYLVDWVSDIFCKPLQAALEEACQRGHLQGRILGETFLPEGLAAVTPGSLRSFFESLTASRPWVSLDEILAGLPELSEKTPDLARALIRATLKESPYRALGGERWTTVTLYDLLNREVPRGLPAARIRSRLNIWTDEDARDLAGYTRKSLPVEARQALDELEACDVLPAPTKKWLPPSSPVKLPTLNYLHITQAYFPVDSLIHAFAPDVRLVFVQFIEGPSQPFLLDRDTGQLKALHPETLRDRILESNIPAGTYLWLEYQGGENYRIAPRPLPLERMVHCKLAYLQNGQLHIEHTQIPMFYEGDSYVFKANMRFEDIEALFAEARQANISVRDAIIYAIQELCEGDLRNRAHRTDIFNAVFLKRMCSPNSVSLLLYTQPCFEQLGEGFFRYRPIALDGQTIPPARYETRPVPVPTPGLESVTPDPLPVSPPEEPAAVASTEPALLLGAPDPNAELQKISQQGQQAIRQGRFAEAEELARRAEQVRAEIEPLQWEPQVPEPIIPMEAPVSVPDPESETEPPHKQIVPEPGPVISIEEPALIPDPAPEPGTPFVESLPEPESVTPSKEPAPSLPELAAIDGYVLVPELEHTLTQETLAGPESELETSLEEPSLEPEPIISIEVLALIPDPAPEPPPLLEESALGPVPQSEFLPPEPATEPRTSRPKPAPLKKPLYRQFISRLRNWLQKLLGGRHD